ncbi:MAG: bifunctional riboflavin kinase/FAD synthetase [Candidatus Omnitrophota bacterium]
MKVLYGYKNLQKKLKDPVAAIGIFDGIHLGHKRVIKKVLNLREPGRDKIIITFEPHPRSILHPEKPPLRIMSLEHRLLILKKMGLDAVVIIRFTDFIASLSPEEFVKKILLGMNVKKIFVGNNFHFGHGKSGNISSFQTIGEECGIDVKIVKPVKKRGKIVSSSWLRKLITDGNIKKAENLLRRPVSILGTVVSGDKRGKSYGIPTANIDPHQEVIPPPGVYAVKADIDGKLFDGVLNIGFRPTFYGRKLKQRKEPQIEVHLTDFKGYLYDKSMEIFFLKKLRREKRFKNEIKLKRQIEKDIKRSNKILASPMIAKKILKYKPL